MRISGFLILGAIVRGQGTATEFPASPKEPPATAPPPAPSPAPAPTPAAPPASPPASSPAPKEPAPAPKEPEPKQPTTQPAQNPPAAQAPVPSVQSPIPNQPVQNPAPQPSNPQPNSSVRTPTSTTTNQITVAPTKPEQSQSGSANSAIVTSLIVLGACLLIMAVGVVFFKLFRKRIYGSPVRFGKGSKDDDITIESLDRVPRSIVYYEKGGHYSTLPNSRPTSTFGKAAARSNSTPTGSHLGSQISDTYLDYNFVDPSSKFIASTALDHYSYTSSSHTPYNHIVDPFADPASHAMGEYKPGDKFLDGNGVEYIVADDYYAYPTSSIYSESDLNSQVGIHSTKQVLGQN